MNELKITYGRLTVVSNVYRKENRQGWYVLTKCECGNNKEVRIDHLNSGKIRSCNCLRNEMNLSRSITHGHSNHPLFNTWLHVKSRCYNPKDKAYHNYGGRGVRMCKQWRNSFVSFYEWAIANGWEIGLHLDKDKLSPNGYGGKLYSPKYCCFLTKEENNRYRRNQFSVEQVLEIRKLYSGGKYTLEKIGEIYNVWGTTIHAIITRKNFSYVD